MKTNTQAKDFLQYAIEFADAAGRLKHGKPFLSHPTFYCVLHSIELALKAHLAHSGVSTRKLAHRKLGHNLGALLRLVIAKRLLQKFDFDSLDQKAITWGGKDYSKKCFEYPELMVSTHPIGKWLPIASKLVKSAEKLLSPKA